MPSGFAENGLHICDLITYFGNICRCKSFRLFAKWYIPFEDVKYEAYNFKDGELANENKLKELADYSAYKAATENALPKFKFNGAMIREFKDVMMPEISPLF